MYDVVALGESLIDFACAGTDDNGYPTLTAQPGGAPANFLAVLSKYGARTAFIGKVGDDSFGHLLKNTLEKAGIDSCGLILDPAVFTTMAFVSLDANGERSFSFARKPGADTCLRFDEIDLSLLDKARVFHFGTLSLTDEPARTATKKAAEYARQKGLLLSFDPNLRPPLWQSLEKAKEEILWGLSMADVVKISDNEVDFLWGCSPQAGAERLLQNYPGLKLAMVTLGAKGCLLQNRTAHCSMTVPPVTPVDTTGAGDIFGGSALSRILKLGKSPEALNRDELLQIARFSSAAASLSTQHPGGIFSVSPIAQVDALCQKSTW